MTNPIGSEKPLDFQLNYIYYADTYALILFKQKKYDAAYKYQNEIYNLDTLGMGADGRERLAMYMEKIKGSEYTKNFYRKRGSCGTKFCGNGQSIRRNLYEIKFTQK